MAISLWSITPSRAALIINAVESGSDVVSTLLGSINSLAGATLFQSGASTFNYNFARADDSSLAITDQSTGSISLYNNYDIPTHPTNFGSGGGALAASSTANTSMFFRRDAPEIWLAQDYVLGTPVTGALTWTGKTFATLGWTEGTYVWRWAGDSVTLNIGGSGPAAVPEPGQVAASLLLLAGIGGYVFLKRRKTAKTAMAAV